MKHDGIDVRAMSLADLELALRWAAAEGWNPGLDDAEAFHAADPTGFLLAEIGGEPVASISIARFGHVGFLGLYICRPDRRGRGVGHALWREAIDLLAPATVGLDGVPAQQSNYAKSGFARSHRAVRYSGVAAAAEDARDPTEPLARAHWPAVAALDRAVTGFDRACFLDRWLFGAESRRARALVRDGRLAGFGAIRRCLDGWKIGPLIAEDAEAAAALFDALAALAEGDPVSLDLPEPNAAAVALAEARGMAPVFETARMWRGRPPEQDLARTWGVASFELG